MTTQRPTTRRRPLVFEPLEARLALSLSDPLVGDSPLDAADTPPTETPSIVDTSQPADDAGSGDASPTLDSTATLTASATMTTTQVARVVAEQIDIAPVWAGHPVRFDLLTHGDWQFVAFYDENRKMTVGSRQIGSSEWTLKTLKSTVGWDSHNYLTIAIDANDQVHVVGNMHTSPLVYYRTTRPLDIASLKRVDQMVGNREDSMTYPRFLRGAENQLIFTYRDGMSGDGETYFNVYDPATEQWTRLFEAPLFSFERPEIVFKPATASGGVALAGDWDGQAGDSAGWFDPKTQVFQLWNGHHSGPADVTIRYDAPLKDAVPLAGDWDGDGIDTVGVYDRATGEYWLLSGDSVSGYPWLEGTGPRGGSAKPLVGDWDGDGIDTLVFYDAKAEALFGADAADASSSGAELPAKPGRKARLVSGDWNGDGTDELGWYESSRKSETVHVAGQVYAYAKLSKSGTLVTGDWVGCGTDTIGAYRKGSFRLRNAAARGDMSAYDHGPVRDSQGVYHLAWVWRDSTDAGSNHDLSYARSRDLIHWENSRGEPIELPLTLRNAEVVDAVPAGGGISNGTLSIGVDAQDRPVISYVKYDADGNTQIYNARLEDGGWNIHQVTSWNYRWDLQGAGSLRFDLRVGPVTVETDGGLSQTYSHVIEGSGIWRLDPDQLTPAGEYPPDETVPPELVQVESSFPGMQARIQAGRGDTAEGTTYLLRWETLPRNQDQPRKKPWPEPSMLRLYTIVEEQVAAEEGQ